MGNELGADQGGQPLVRLDKALAASSRGLLVFVDRMDLLVERLAANDRDWELRKTLQTDQRIILIGSAEALPRQATSYKRAFYCFFSERYAGLKRTDRRASGATVRARRRAAKECRAGGTSGSRPPKTPHGHAGNEIAG